jgi:dTDP-glucose 4,6-dehydratase
MRRVLLTGAAGFVGSHVLRHLLMETDWEIVCPVTFRHKGTPARMHSSMDSVPEGHRRVSTVILDLTAPVDRVTASRIGAVDYILNVASESHVDRSLECPAEFVTNNVSLMLNMLELARLLRPSVFLQMSTDEVYGPAAPGYNSREWDVIAPSNPYSASKAAQEAIAFSYWRSYGVPVVITNTMNIIGEMQDSEKFVPMIIRSLTAGQPVPVHCSPDGTPGSRFYLHARNLADAWLWLLNHESSAWNLQTYSGGHTRPSRFNIVGEREIDNIELVEMIARFVRTEPLYRRVSFHESRPGHDLRYALDGSLLTGLGWTPPHSLEDSLRKTVDWTLANPEWLR